MTELRDPASMTEAELTAYVKEHGWPGFRADQIFGWIHAKQTGDPEEMKNLPKDIRKVLAEDMRTVREWKRLISKEDGTEKFLFMLSDGQIIETVFMPYHHGNSLCISSQAGCRMGCRFCASTIGGLVRNLTPSEMLGQVYQVVSLTGKRVDSIVVMGTGEPLDNYENLLRFLRLISDPKGYGLSLRSITVSSCGLVPKIRQLAGEGVPITFALSLHATTDEERKALMPIANRYTLAETLDACRYYFEKTHRRVTFEYSLVKGVNDTAEHAKRLAALLGSLHGHVNLIPVNPIDERDYRKSDPESVQLFKNILERNRINVTIRRSMGRDIDAACGQLRRRAMQEQDEKE